jgi:hypothetical protein
MVLQEISNAGTKVNPSRQGQFAKEYIDKTFVLCTAPFVPNPPAFGPYRRSYKQGAFGVEIRSEKRDLLGSEIVFGLFYPLHGINDVGQALRVKPYISVGEERSTSMHGASYVYKGPS